MSSDLIRKIKDRANCANLFRRYYPANYRERDNSVCPYHNDTDAADRRSLSLSQDKIHCFGACGKSWDAIDIVETAEGISKRDAIALLARELGLEEEQNPSRKPSEKEKKPKDFLSRWHGLKKNTISDDAIAYFEERRGLTNLLPELQAAGLIGFDPRYRQYNVDGTTNERSYTEKPAFAFPVTDWNGDKLFGIQMIPIDGSTKKFLTGTENKEGFLRYGNGETFQVVTEAAIDGFSAYHACQKRIDITIICLFSASTIQKLKAVPGILIPFFDNDFAGLLATIKTLLMLPGRIRLVDWSQAPDGHKDLNDLLRAGHDRIITQMVTSSRLPHASEVGETIQGLLPRLKDMAVKENKQDAYYRFLSDAGITPKEKDDQAQTRYYNRTAYGNAERLCAMHGENIRYCYPSDKWFVWDGMRFCPDSTGAIERLAKQTVRQIGAEASQAEDEETRKALLKHALKSEGKSELKAMVDLSRSEPGVAIMPEHLDANHWTLNTQTGVLDLKTGGIVEHDRSFLITKLAPVDFKPGATCPTWMKFLDRIQAGNRAVIDFLQRAVGYSLTGDTSEQCVFFLYGTGANGKSTFLEVIQTILGDYSQRTEFATFLAKNNETVRNDIARLKSARFVSAVEAGKGKSLAEDVIKQLTGDDTITARFLFQEYFEFLPAFKVFLATNHKPIIKGNDHAIWRRIKLIPFNVTIPEEERDKALKTRLLDELPGILNWAIQGCLEWQRNGLQEPEEVQYATKSYQAEMDTLTAFFEDRCIVNPLARVPLKELYVEYCKWAQANGEPEISQRTLNGQLAERGYQQRKGAKGLRLWLGVGLAAEQFAPGGRTDCHPATQNEEFCHPGQLLEMSGERHDLGGQVAEGGTKSPVIQSNNSLAYGGVNSATFCHPGNKGPESQENTGGKTGVEGGGGVAFRCATCRYFVPSQMNANGCGVCENDELEGNAVKLPTDGADCKLWQPEY